MLSRRAFLASTGLAAPVATAQTPRPNIVFVLVDDMRWDDLHCTGHPFALTPHADRLSREGANFTSAFAVTPLCSPSRASFLTGQYPHRHGIVDNTDRSPASHALVTWPRQLHDQGYETSFVGKWHMGNDDSPRPGFDHWVSFPGQGECVDPILNVNGKRDRTKGYITDLLTEHAVGFLDKPRSTPFCLYLAHKAIHPNIAQAADGSIRNIDPTGDGFIPAERHRDLYRGKAPPRRKNYARVPVHKPALGQKIPGVEPLGPKTLIEDETILNRLRMAKAVDEGLGQLLLTLERRRVLDETMVIFTSDHGYFYGEHYLGHERRLAYEETIRIPMLVRYPKLFRAGSRPKDFFLNTDVANLCLRQAMPPSREDFLIEYESDTVFPRIRKMGYRAIRTRRWKYINYRELPDSDELYDLASDPYELNNRIHDAGTPLEDMKQRLSRAERA